MHDLDLNLLRSLDALLRERNITRAAAAVGVRQPAMSSALRRLRRAFDDELLVRVGRRYELTPRAAELVGPLTQILARIEALIQPARTFDPSTADRSFTLRLSDHAMTVLVAPLVERVSAEAPRVVLHVERPKIVRSLEQARDADLWVLPSYLDNDPGIELFSDRFLCAVAHDHPEVGDSISAEQFQQLRHIRFLSGGFTTTADHRLDSLGVRRTVVVTVGAFVTALFMLRGTPYLTLAPERLARGLADAAGIKLLRLPWDIPPASHRLYWRGALDDDAGHRWLRDLVVEVARSL